MQVSLQAGCAKAVTEKQADLEVIVRESFLTDDLVNFYARMAIEQSLAQNPRQIDPDVAFETLKNRLGTDLSILQPIVSKIEQVFSKDEASRIASWFKSDLREKYLKMLEPMAESFVECVCKTADEILGAYPNVNPVQPSPSSVVEITNQNYLAEVINSKIPVVVDAYASWCGPCKMLAPIIEELNVQLEGKVKFCKLNVEQQLDLGKELGINAFPTLVFVKDGVELDRFVGLLDKEGLLKMIIQVALKKT